MTNTDLVRDRLVEALATLMAVRDWRTLPSEFGDYWQPLISSLLATAGILQAAARGGFPEPSPERIARAVEALGWLRLVPSIERQIVTGLCSIPPGWSQSILTVPMLATGLRLDKGAVQSRFDRAMRFIGCEIDVARIEPAELPPTPIKKRRAIRQLRSEEEGWTAV